MQERSYFDAIGRDPMLEYSSVTCVLNIADVGSSEEQNSMTHIMRYHINQKTKR